YIVRVSTGCRCRVGYTPRIQICKALNGKVTAAENNLAAEVAQGLHLPATGGSDAHAWSEGGTYATRFEVAIGSEADLLAALKTGHYAPLAFRQNMAAVASV
ncbi:MAG: PHP-associated domain-containing protein, partial [Desulfobacterales bacterium]